MPERSRELVELAAHISGAPGLRIRQAVIMASGEGLCDVRIGGGSTTITGVRVMSTVPPMVGDHVWLLINNRDMIALGSTRAAAPVVRLELATDQNMAIGTDYVLWDAAPLDPIGAWSSGNAGRMTLGQLPGYWQVHQIVLWDNVGGGTFRQSGIEINGATMRGYENMAPTTAFGVTTQSACSARYFSAGDYCRVRTNHDAGGARTIKATVNGPYFWAHWLGPQA